jgi:hypothetical protein
VIKSPREASRLRYSTKTSSSAFENGEEILMWACTVAYRARWQKYGYMKNDQQISIYSAVDKELLLKKIREEREDWVDKSLET